MSDTTTPDTTIPDTTILPEGQSLWGISYTPVGCDHCHHTYLTPLEAKSRKCPSCIKGTLQSQPASLRPEPPESMLPFAKFTPDLQGIYSNFVKPVWLAPDDFKPEILLSRSLPIFWPMWLVDCTVTGSWQAEMGFNYQVKSSKEYYSGNAWESRDIVEERTNYELRLGTLQHQYDNISIPALARHNERMQQLGSYPFKGAIGFAANLVGAAHIELPDLIPEEVWDQAEIQLKKAAGSDCREACGAQHVRNFCLQGQFTQLNWTQFLLPMYASWYMDDEGLPHSVLVNGQTGQIFGERLASQKKGNRAAGIIAAGAVGLFLLAATAFLIGMVLPPIQPFTALLALIGFLTALAALVPLIWPWQWNRKIIDRKVYQSSSPKD